MLSHLWLLLLLLPLVLLRHCFYLVLHLRLLLHDLLLGLLLIHVYALLRLLLLMRLIYLLLLLWLDRLVLRLRYSTVRSNHAVRCLLANDLRLRYHRLLLCLGSSCLNLCLRLNCLPLVLVNYLMLGLLLPGLGLLFALFNSPDGILLFPFLLFLIFGDALFHVGLQVATLVDWQLSQLESDLVTAVALGEVRHDLDDALRLNLVERTYLSDQAISLLNCERCERCVRFIVESLGSCGIGGGFG